MNLRCAVMAIAMSGTVHQVAGKDEYMNGAGGRTVSVMKNIRAS
jgi:hypothetical protein